MMRFVLGLALALLATLCQAQAPARFSFAIVGDAPYNDFEETVFKGMLEEINQEELAFVIHVGDIKSGTSPCSDELYERRNRLFQASRHPFILIPGDNDWTDCHRKSAGGYDPLERLARLRELFYPDDYSLGQRKLRLERQSADPRFAEYRENLRWRLGAALFIGLNLPGSNNNLGRTPQMNAEYSRRSAANAAWLAEGFDLANKNNHETVFIAIQANPKFEPSFWRPAIAADGYAAFRKELLAHTLGFGKPVILIHGDTHRYRVDQPLVDPATRKPVENFTRIESFGSPFLDWIRIGVDPADPKLFTIRTGKAVDAAQ